MSDTRIIVAGPLALTEHEYLYDLTGDERASVSRSTIHKMITKSPAHARAAHPKLNPDWVREEKKAFDVGTVCHQLLLDGAAGVQVLPFDSWRTKDSKEQAATARQHGLIPLLEHEWALVDQAMSTIRERIDAREDDPPLFTDGESEVSLVWEESGVLCRARLDWLSTDRRIVDDFKTSSNAEPTKFSRGSFFDYGYDLQAAFYQRGVRACFGVDPTFRLLVVEKEPPFELIVFDAAPDTLALANAKIDWALEVWRDCLEHDSWPGYERRTHSVTLPPWAEEQWLSRVGMTLEAA